MQVSPLTLAPRRAVASIKSAPRAVLTCTTWRGQPVAPAVSMATVIAASSARAGREARESRAVWPLGERCRPVRDVLPLGAAGLVEVDVRIDAAGEHMEA